MKVFGPHAVRVDQWLRYDAALRKCPVCGTWEEGFTTEDITSIGPSMSVVPVSCNKCGNTMLVRAERLGIS